MARGLFSQTARRASLLYRQSTVTFQKTAVASSLLSNQRWMSSYPPHELVGMPSLSPTMEEGAISKWHLAEGDEFGAGDVLCEVETDKASVDYEAQDDGVVAKILAEAGSGAMACGEPICIIVEDAADVAAFQDYVVEAGAPAAEAPAEAPAAPAPAAPAAPAEAPAAPVAAAAPVTAGDKIVGSPLAFKTAKELGIDIGAVVGTGPGGRVIVDDVKEYVPAAAPAAVAASPIETAVPIAGAGYTDFPISADARDTAARLAHSKQNVPHYYLTVDVRLDNLLNVRKFLNESLAEDEQISVNDLFIKAAASSMKTVPSANAAWMDSVVRVYDNADINVVVGSGDGLYTPVVRDAGRIGLKAISSIVSNATTAAADGTLTAEDCAVGSFTMMNLGMYGIKSCAPVIMEPQAGILALGAAENRIVPGEGDEEYQQVVVVTATVSLDHRVIDGAVGAQWLAAFKSHVENPETLIL